MWGGRHAVSNPPLTLDPDPSKKSPSSPIFRPRSGSPASGKTAPSRENLRKIGKAPLSRVRKKKNTHLQAFSRRFSLYWISPRYGRRLFPIQSFVSPGVRALKGTPEPAGNVLVKSVEFIFRSTRCWTPDERGSGDPGFLTLAPTEIRNKRSFPVLKSNVDRLLDSPGFIPPLKNTPW